MRATIRPHDRHSSDAAERPGARRRALLAILATVTAVSAGGMSQAASPVVHGEGTYAVTGVEVHATRQLGSATIVTQTLSIGDHGVLDGPSTADVVCAFESSGEGACVGSERFVGPVDGRTGSATFAVGLTVDATGFHGRFVAVDGGGGLAGLHRTGAFEGGPTGTNSFDHWFTLVRPLVHLTAPAPAGMPANVGSGGHTGLP